MTLLRSWISSASLALLISTSVAAEPLAREAVPDPLKPWVQWVLMDEKDAACPFVQSKVDHRQCVWPTRLNLTLDDTKGAFRQEWLVYRDTWVPLPGDAKIWPQSVRIGEAPAVVVSRAGVPSVHLEAGRHQLSGSYRWPALPELLKIPAETGLLSLTLRSEPVHFPSRDLQGRLWLQKPPQEGETESRLDVSVHRRVIDEIPLQLESQIELKVSGKNREVLLGRALPDGFVPLSLQAPLPARIESDGRLRVQVRPGTWRLTLSARSNGPLNSLSLPESEGTWDAEEVWVFDARNHLRLVNVEGAVAIDPQQTTLPTGWMHLPAYLMKRGIRMQLVEKRRGDADPAPDQLSLKRTLWLDFDGAGYTLHDRLSGTLSQSWRLEMAEPMELGRVAVDGQDRFISRLAESGRAGVEIRQGAVQIDADSRFQRNGVPLPAVGWNHDFQQVSGQLNLPPGWRLFHASGVDDVQSTWITRWSLLEIFMVLITAMAVGHLWGWRWGLLAGVTLTLIYPEANAPRWSWLALLAAQALLRVVPQGRFRSLIRIYWLVAVVALAAVAIPFAAQQVRQALYPSLEYPWISIRAERVAQDAVVMAEGEASLLAGSANKAMLQEQLSHYDRRAAKAPARGSLLRNYYAPDPSARVSTGPGLPHWGWRVVRLNWRGPVERIQTLRLLLMPPWANFLLAWIRVALLVALTLCVLDLGQKLGPWLPRRGHGRGAATAAALALALVSASLPRVAAAEFPSSELLGELRERLLENPECFPECASSPRLRLKVTPKTLRIRMQIDAAWQTAVPLPGGAKHWLPETVLLDGHPAQGIAQSPDGLLWIQLSPGQHQVLLEGPLPEREAVQIPLPLRPRQIHTDVKGWVLDGVQAGGLADHNLQLTRIRDENGPTGPALESTHLPPFLRVERELQLGLSWQMSTRVVRLSPPGNALLVDVPLLSGESVTTEGIRVEEEKVLVNMGPQVSSIQWTSTLAHAPELKLRAPDSVPWTEIWRVDAAPVWHVETLGIPVIHQPRPGSLRVREWRPWPGESVSIQISRPKGVDGRTFTIDRTNLNVSPGLRASDVKLHLVLRASRGAQHGVTLPEGAELQWVEIDGERQPIRQVERVVTLPIHPGKHTATIAWKQPDGIRMRFETPLVDLRTSSVNTEVQIEMPADRWILFAGGPRMGPAVLFWSLLCIVLIVSIGLGKVPLTPLRWTSWLLLFIGLTQVPIGVSFLVAGWLIALGWRSEHAREATPKAFDLLQLLLGFWTVAAMFGLLWAIQNGLLGLPDMHVTGNGSSAHELRWYQDRSPESLPTAWVISVPLGFYRLAILAWALWLARALISWLRWGWACYTEGGLWQPFRKPEQLPDW